jgi:hypothetical protein
MDNRNYSDEVAWFPWNIYSPLNAWKIMLPHHWLPKDNLILRNESAIWNNYRGGACLAYWGSIRPLWWSSRSAADTLIILSHSVSGVHFHYPDLYCPSVIQLYIGITFSLLHTIIPLFLVLHKYSLSCHTLGFHYPALCSIPLYCHSIIQFQIGISLSCHTLGFHYPVLYLIP